MTVNELYNELMDNISSNTLIINKNTINNSFGSLPNSFDTDEIRIKNCSVKLSGGIISVVGTADIKPYDSLGTEMVSARLWIDNGNLKYTMQISVSGSGLLKDICNTKKTLIDKDSFFDGFVIVNPVITAVTDELGYRISGNAVSNSEAFLNILPTTMTFKGIAYRVSGIMGLFIDFSTGISSFSFPLGTAEVILTLRTMDLHPEYCTDPRVYGFLLFKLNSGKGKDMTFQVDISSIGKGSFYGTAFFFPVLSPKNAEKFLSEMFGSNDSENSFLLPDCAILSDFGLQRISLRLNPKGERLTDGFDIEYAESTFILEKPWNTPIPCLTLTDFTVFSEISYINEYMAVSLTASCKAEINIGKYTVTGRIKGYYPQQHYEGSLSLTKANDNEVNLSDEESSLSLSDMAEEFHCPVPESWNNSLAEFSIIADISERSYSLTASAYGIIEITFGNLKISVDSIVIDANIKPSGNTFSFNGEFGFDTEIGRYTITLAASYDKYWSFSGELSNGNISLGNLLYGLFGISASSACADIVVDGLSVSFAPSKEEFSLFASFYISWFEVLGFKPKLGGRIKLLKTSDNGDALYGSALFYLDIGALNFLVQAEDFYTDNIRYLFRLSFNKLYLQGVYYKEQSGDEILTFSLGGMTFGDVVLAFIHLINPNAKASLSSPWNVLNKIDLSDFSIVVNATQKNVSVLYSANISIAGLMQIDDIGIRYSYRNNEDKLSYILTGRLCSKTYGIEDPLSWDAIDGAPPANTATGETKTKVSYIGFGSHLKMDADMDNVADAVERLKEKLKPVGENTADFEYSENNHWIFGADFTLGDLFRLQIALIDPNLYGAKINIDVTKSSALYFFNGLELELVYRKISDSVGMFRCTVTFPKSMSKLDLGAVVIMLGEISLEIYSNGSFLIDLGFPHGGDFSRSFGLEYGIFAGRGGIYFGCLKGDAVKSVPKITNGAFTPVLLIGIGLCVGIGHSFDFGIVKGGVSITASGILEGAFALFRPSDSKQKEGLYYSVYAAVGISGTLFLSADLKIITISVSANINALCELKIESYRRSELKLSLHLKLSASIKILFIKINFSFTFDKTVELTFGKDSEAPWKLENQKEALPVKNYDLELFPCVKLGEWELTSSVLPIFSVKNPITDKMSEYCAAFLCVVSTEDFAKLAEMLFSWILYSFPDDNVPRDMAASVSENAAESLSFADFNGFFEKNLQVELKPETENESDNDLSGVFFPMPHCIRLCFGETEIDFGQNYVTEEYCNSVSEYLSKLNSDPFHEIPQTDASNDSFPICAAILTDYFRMLLSELISLMHGIYDNISVTACSFEELSEHYGLSSEEFLEKNPDVLLNIDSVPKYTYTIQPEDTLHSICERFSADAVGLWNDISDISLIPASGKTVSLNDYRFDNSTVKMTAKEAAAVFFVRLYDPDIIYFKYAEKIVSDNSLEQDWHSDIFGSRKLTVTGWSGDYTALAGDNTVRAAKAAALINGETAEGWESFLQHFLSLNNDGAEYYCIDGAYLIKDRTLRELTLRLCPDFTGEIQENFLWQQPILASWKDIVISDACIGLKSVTFGQSGITQAEAASALNSGTAELSHSQLVDISPNMLSKEELIRLILTDENTARTGSMISRFFLQGLRIPSPDGAEIMPMFELLGQQTDFAYPAEEFSFSISKSDTVCGWVSVSDKNTAYLDKDALAEAVPDGRLPKTQLPEKAEDFSQMPRCWSPSDVEIVTGKNTQKSLYILPEDMCEYFTRCSTDTIEMMGGENNIEWACLTKFTISKAGRNIYRFGGTSPQERSGLYELIGKKIAKLHILCRSSAFDTDTAEYTEIDPERCILIRSDLSTQTHMESMDSDLMCNIAYIGEPNNFLLLAWECSVIGDGYLLCCTDIPDSIFDSDGKADIYLLTITEEKGLCGSFVNRAVLDGLCEDKPVFTSTAEKTYVPNYPVGSIGIYADGNISDGDRMSELFSIMGYTVKTDNDTVLEAMPILPQQTSDGSVFYSAAVPLYRLCGDTLSPYSAIGSQIKLDFFLRDVLGNTLKLGAIDVEADYNDYLMSINQLPCTDTKYRVKKIENDIRIIVSMSCTKPADEDKEQAEEAALTAMRQALCDIEISFSSTLDARSSYILNDDEISKYREFTCAVYESLCGKSELSETVFSFSFVPDLGKLPDEVFKIELTSKITRKNCKCGYSGIKSAECLIMRSEDFEEEFEAALPDILLAEGSGGLYGIPKKEYFEDIAVTPFTFETENGSKLSPRFYSAKPFSSSLITRTSEVNSFGSGEKTEIRYVDIDIEFWVKRFLGDAENILSGDIVSNAAEKCPKTVNSLIEAKGIIAERFADRMIPLIDGFFGDDISSVRETAVQLFKKSLNNVYDSDVFCVYSSEFGCSDNHACRLEGTLNGSDGLHSQKADSEKKYLCIYSSGTQKHSNESAELSMSFIHFEYDIHKEASGYENSKWLRLLSPLISDKIDLRAELGIPHPLKLFPDNPKLISQSSTAQSEMLRYRYTVRISCKAYEQHTLYLRLKMGYIHSRRDQIENKLFDILADYDYNRVEILRHISDADEDFTKACERILNTANSFADAMPQEGADEVSDTQSNEIILKINFDLSGETAAICAVYGENSREFAEKYHINVPDTAKIISGGEYGKETVIEAELYNMPIYTCFSVEPSLWIVQNENLFGSHNVQVSKEFLFQTETVFLQPLYVHAEYSETLSADGVEQAAEKVWDRLELTDDFKSADAAVTCCFELDTDSEHKLSVRVPAVFLPKAISAANISDSVRTWLALSRRDMQPSALIFKINVYVESNYDSVINAEITVNILKDNNMSDMQIL